MPLVIHREDLLCHVKSCPVSLAHSALQARILHSRPGACVNGWRTASGRRGERENPINSPTGVRRSITYGTCRVNKREKEAGREFSAVISGPIYTALSADRSLAITLSPHRRASRRADEKLSA